VEWRVFSPSGEKIEVERQREGGIKISLKSKLIFEHPVVWMAMICCAILYEYGVEVFMLIDRKKRLKIPP
jgi:hypothetical protein